METGNGNGNGNGTQQWVSFYRVLAIGLLGTISYLVANVHSEIKEQSKDIIKIKVDGADVKSTLTQLDYRVKLLENAKDNKK